MVMLMMCLFIVTLLLPLSWICGGSSRLFWIFWMLLFGGVLLLLWMLNCCVYGVV